MEVLQGKELNKSSATWPQKNSLHALNNNQVIKRKDIRIHTYTIINLSQDRHLDCLQSKDI